MLVPNRLDTNMAAGNQCKQLTLIFIIKAISLSLRSKNIQSHIFPNTLTA